MPPQPSNAIRPDGLSRDFWKFWIGQTVSNLGNSVTFLALPLIVYALTGSALNLAVSTAAGTLPYLLFGLIIGAWVDRADRKRVMIVVDLLRAAALCSIALTALFDALTVWQVYAVAFIVSTLTIFFDSSEFAAIPNLVSGDDLVTANGRIQASYSGAMVLGPLLAGAALAVVAVDDLVLIDAATFLVSAASLALIRRSFNPADGGRRTTKLRADVMEGLRYVLGHPVLRAISAMMLLANFVGVTIQAQLVLFADEQLGVGDRGVGLLYSASSAGVVVLALLAGRLRRRWPFSRVALGALVVNGLATLALALTTSFIVALPLMALVAGSAILFNINTGSLRQTIVPNALLGRVMSIAAVLATLGTPVGALLGGAAIEWTGNVAVVYGAIGVLTALIALSFGFFTALGRAERYLPAEAPAPAADLVAR